MSTYIVLTSFTDQGIRSVKDTTKRADAVKELAKKFGVTAKEFFWTLGNYDVVVIFDAPDDASMTALGLAIGAGGKRPDPDLASILQKGNGRGAGQVGIEEQCACLTPR